MTRSRSWQRRRGGRVIFRQQSLTAIRKVPTAPDAPDQHAFPEHRHRWIFGGCGELEDRVGAILNKSPKRLQFNLIQPVMLGGKLGRLGLGRLRGDQWRRQETWG